MKKLTCVYFCGVRYEAATRMKWTSLWLEVAPNVAQQHALPTFMAVHLIRTSERLDCNNPNVATSWDLQCSS